MLESQMLLDLNALQYSFNILSAKLEAQNWG